jgi:hypothetical protein
VTQVGERERRKTYREGADGVDGELVDLSVRHDGQTVRMGRKSEEGEERGLCWVERRLCRPAMWVAHT